MIVGFCDPAPGKIDSGAALPGVGYARVARIQDRMVWTTPAEDENAATPGRPASPADMICFAATTAEGLALARACSEEVSSMAGLDVPVLDLVEITKPNRRKVIADACIETLATRARRASHLAGTLSGALASLRREYETTLERFLALESSMIAQDLQPVRAVCSQDKIEAFVELGDASAFGRMAMVDLPFSTSGLFSLSLNIDATEAEGPLDVRIETRGVGRPLARWTIDLKPGPAAWRAFTRRVAMSAPHAAARLIISYRGEGSVRIGMGPRHPARSVWLSSGSGEQEPRLIAMRALASNPGLAAPGDGEGDDASTRVRLWGIDTAHACGPAAEEGAASVSAAPEGGLLLSPSAMGPAIAALPDALVRGASVVMATAVAAHPEAPLIEFAIAIGDPDEIGTLLAVGELDAYEGFSGWSAAEAHGAVSLVLELPEPARGGEALVFLARLSPDAAHDWFCRAVFRSVVLLVGQDASDG